MKTLPKVAILTATYNRPNLLKRNIDALLNQDYSNWEHFIVNDGSEEQYGEIEKFVDGNSKINYYKLPRNKGLNHALNFGLEKILASECEYIVIVDDDWLASNGLMNAAKMINQYPEQVWLVFNCGNVSKYFNIQDIEEIRSIQYPKEYQKKVVGDKAHVVKNSCLRENLALRFSKHIKNGHENIFWYKLSRKSNCLLINQELVIKEYQEDGLSLSPLYKHNYLKRVKISFLYVLDNTTEWYYYKLFLKRLFPIGKNFRNMLKNIMGERYYEIKKQLEKIRKYK